MFHRRVFLLILCLVFTIMKMSAVLGQNDSVSGKRKIIAGSLITAGWAGSMGGLYSVWYSKEDQSAFHTFNDGKLWMQMDKVGHTYTAYQISSLTNDLFEWAGCKNKSAALLSGGIGLGYQTTLEIFDGMSSDWGFSWHDMSANFLGSAIFTTQELIWDEQRILPKFSYHPTPFAQIRPEILGSSFGQRLLKDYNGQTYWISFNPFQNLHNSRIPKWICVSIGYSANEKLKGDTDWFTDKNGQTYHAQREWLLSFDIDFSKIPAKKPLVKKVLKQLNYLKIPFPALMLRSGVLHGIPIYF
jgi:hypothetical protein